MARRTLTVHLRIWRLNSNFGHKQQINKAMAATRLVNEGNSSRAIGWNAQEIAMVNAKVSAVRQSNRKRLKGIRVTHISKMLFGHGALRK
jgi:hypothetical protein